jgi:hypothetical protein
LGGKIWLFRQFSWRSKVGGNLLYSQENPRDSCYCSSIVFDGRIEPEQGTLIGFNLVWDGDRYTKPRALAFDEHLHASFGGLGLRLKSAQGPNSKDYATNPDKHQKASKHRIRHCETERPAIDTMLSILRSLVFGGFLIALGTAMCFNDQRCVLRASLIGTGLVCAEFGLLLLVMAGLYHYTWGSPPQWLPARWNPCAQNEHQYFPGNHRETVSQKVLTWVNIPYCNEYMANVLSTEKQIGIIGALCEGSRIRSIERMTGVHRDTIMRLGVKFGRRIIKYPIESTAKTARAIPTASRIARHRLRG